MKIRYYYRNIEFKDSIVEIFNRELYAGDYILGSIMHYASLFIAKVVHIDEGYLWVEVDTDKLDSYYLFGGLSVRTEQNVAPMFQNMLCIKISEETAMLYKGKIVEKRNVINNAFYYSIEKEPHKGDIVLYSTRPGHLSIVATEQQPDSESEPYMTYDYEYGIVIDSKTCIDTFGNLNSLRKYVILYTPLNVDKCAAFETETIKKLSVILKNFMFLNITEESPGAIYFDMEKYEYLMYIGKYRITTEIKVNGVARETYQFKMGRYTCGEHRIYFCQRYYGKINLWNLVYDESRYHSLSIEQLMESNERIIYRNLNHMIGNLEVFRYNRNKKGFVVKRLNANDFPELFKDNFIYQKFSKFGKNAYEITYRFDKVKE